jgi:hypothetical protein
MSPVLTALVEVAVLAGTFVGFLRLTRWITKDDVVEIDAGRGAPSPTTRSCCVSRRGASRGSPAVSRR